MQSPVLVLKDSLTCESGSKVHHANIQASKESWSFDGNAILRELDLAHPAAKSMMELSRTQDEEVGDGTTSVIVLAGEMLHVLQLSLTRAIILQLFVELWKMLLLYLKRLRCPLM